MTLNHLPMFHQKAQKIDGGSYRDGPPSTLSFINALKQQRFLNKFDSSDKSDNLNLNQVRGNLTFATTLTTHERFDTSERDLIPS